MGIQNATGGIGAGLQGMYGKGQPQQQQGTGGGNSILNMLLQNMFKSNKPTDPATQFGSTPSADRSSF